MAELTYEIASWQASEALKKDLNILKPVVEVIKRHTPYPVFAGISVESSKFYISVAWESTEAHKKFMAHPDIKSIQTDFASLFPEGGAAAAGSTVLHAHFDSDPLAVFTAPVTEHAFLTPKDGVPVEDLKDAFKRMDVRLAEHKDMCVASVVGKTEERPDQLTILVGWQSIEAHQKFNAPGGPGADELGQEIVSKLALEKAVVEHVHYIRFA